MRLCACVPFRLPHHQHRILVPREPLETYGHGTRGGWRLVHDHEAERAGAQQDVGTPPRALRAPRADDPERAEIGEVRGTLRGEGAGGVHERHSFVGPQRRFCEREEEGSATTAEWGVEGRDLSARQAEREQAVERGDAEREPAARGGDEPLQPLGENDVELRHGHGYAFPMNSSAATAALFLLCAVPLAAQQPVGGARPTRAPRADDVAPAEVVRLLGALSDDSLEGRDTGSRGSAAAARIIAAELRAAGARPGGDSGYFQRVPVARTTVTSQGRTRTRTVLLPDLAAGDTLAAESRLPVTAVNVIGVLPGRDPQLRDEAVVVTAHYDHLGIGQPVNGDSVYNGADDDASGTAAALEIARLLGQGPAPKRTVVFLLVTGEERGMLGTRWYIDHPVIPLDHTVANFNIEMIGRPDSLAGGPGAVWLTGFDRSTMGAMLREAGIPIIADPRPEQRFFERSDNYAFVRRGVVAHTLSTYDLHADYHRPSDEVRFTNPAHMAQVIGAAARAVRLLADGPAPQWTPGGRPGGQ